MTPAPRRAWLLMAGLLVVGLPVHVSAQGWSVDLSAGRMVYDPVSVAVGTNNLMGTLRYDTFRGAWVYGSAAAPLQGGDPAWGAFGAGGRFLPSGSAGRRAAIGVDVDAHGFVFHDAVAAQNGRGGTIGAIPFTSLSAGSGRFELRGGWRGETLSYVGPTENRGVFEAGGRVSYGEAVRVQGDLKWVHATEGTYPFAGASLVYSGTSLQAWVQAGKWLSDVLDDVAWGGGVGVPLGNRATLWANVRQDAPDPLYWNAVRRTWSVGVTQRLGRPVPALQPAPRTDAGGALIRVSASEVPDGALSIAGDFNNWKAEPMKREGREWVIRLPLAPGVYHYAFRSGDGEWFVPASVAGRRDDGMGGHVAVLVVS